MSPNLLHIDNLSIRFGGLQVLNGLSLQLQKGKILGLMGPNGCGKSTLFNCIGGQYQADSGRIFFQGQEIQRLASSQIAKMGLARTFQHPRLFDGLTVRDHAWLARERHWQQSRVSVILPFWGQRKRQSDQSQTSRIEHWLEALQLNEVADAFPRELPFVTQKRVELLRALATEPTLLLLDEPAAGLNERELVGWPDLLRKIANENGISMLIIEHQLPLLRSLTQRIGVMNEGQVIALGTYEEILENEAVREVYWGVGVEK